ncbi:uncharacterized protein LOC118168023 isoform X1 [Oxyura jamaicensis]|uniref:uncharacterized protein LOC118168023 isoform X1 n=1 Tax=Oxyura jamaicensis TaxID=8884 RepID=UPI0015A72C10|nr:uncharacterized protein LOC118168023 isoform X1 [Oxyura jamaicensis]
MALARSQPQRCCRRPPPAHWSRPPGRAASLAPAAAAGTAGKRESGPTTTRRRRRRSRRRRRKRRGRRRESGGGERHRHRPPRPAAGRGEADERRPAPPERGPAAEVKSLHAALSRSYSPSQPGLPQLQTPASCTGRSPPTTEPCSERSLQRLPSHAEVRSHLRAQSCKSPTCAQRLKHNTRRLVHSLCGFAVVGLGQGERSRPSSVTVHRDSLFSSNATSVQVQGVRGLRAELGKDPCSEERN